MKAVLILDETCLSAGMLEMMIADISQVLSHYAEFESGEIEVHTKHRENGDKRILYFTVSVPVQRLIRTRNE